MSTMVMCPEAAGSGGVFPRYPSPPVANYSMNGFGYPGAATGAQHPQDYNQFQVPDGPMQQAWYNAMYSGRPEDWGYGPPVSTPAASPPAMSAYYRPGQMGLDYSQGGQISSPLSESPADTSTSSSNADSPSNKQLRPPYDWMKKAAYQTAPTNGKTRTKDKYRVVYSDHQRLELEKEFHYSRYITIRRKAELAQTLTLSERQVKIWFQNRRAKERKQNKKQDGLIKLPTSPDMPGLADDSKHLVQQQMNMAISGAHPGHQAHNVGQLQSPSPPPIHTHQHSLNPYQLNAQMNAQVQGHCHQTLSTTDVMSHVGHISPHAHYSPEMNHQSPPLMAGSPSCSLSPVTIKRDLDAQDFVSS